jgi:hypothetical protein
MEYREIVAVTGLGGLFQLLTTKSDGAIVRNIADKTTKFISARLYNVTPLESIEIYTTGDNVRLHEVFEIMKDNEKSTPLVDAKDNNAVKGYFQKVMPTLDEERVYVSDMKKILKWYELLKASDLLDFEKLKQQQAAANEATEVEEVAEEKEAPAKKTAAKKTAKADKEDGEAEEKKAPAKKTAAKKTAKADSEDGEAPAKKAPAKKTAAKKKAED